MRKSYARLRLGLVALANLGLILASLPATHAQEPRAKLRISNAGFTITALPKNMRFSSRFEGNHNIRMQARFFTLRIQNDMSRAVILNEVKDLIGGLTSQTLGFRDVL